MQTVTLYTTQLCGYCHAAKRLLTSKGIEFVEIDVARDPSKRKEMMEKSGRRTVPQIWVGKTHVGGCDDLFALENEGALDPLVAG
ncbi:MAG: glutaredoxin 3 [Maritimibacter sp.]